ncbi:unnamed protein product [Heligmosomoides polygyrus]|uniref:60S acidic ribosomal protein P1 n=1 Tax=Heligmosomoides polygyrus TaxID=6339 RepID=A0A183FD38_HELPZ|nr:unnamed protein product [Heligmosomoides polygyrus]
MVISRMPGKSIEEIIADGSSGLFAISGGAPAAAAVQEAKPAKKEEKRKSDKDMGFGLFDHSFDNFGASND